MTNMYKIIEGLCKEHSINITQFCKNTGIPRSVFSELKAGRTKKLSSKYLPIVAEYFSVTTDFLLGNADKKEKAHALAEEPTAEAFEQKLYRALVSGGIVPPGGDLTDKQVEILDAIATIIDATFGD